MAFRRIPLLLLLLAFGCGGEATITPTLDLSGGELPADLQADDAVPDGTSPDGEAELVPQCKPDEPCDDGDPCTDEDLCIDGVCQGTPVDCDDGLDCTLDLCVEDGACDNSLRDGFCFIDEVCYKEGAGHPESPCLECITAVSVDQWSADNGNPCDDGNACTTDDACKAGLCLGKAVQCPADTPCATHTCVDGTCEKSLVEGPCGEDACREWTCEEGECLPGPSMECNDDNPCTDDQCDPAVGCVYLPNAEPCDDGNQCTVGDACGGGTCQPGAEKPLCDDGNPCTDDSCHPEMGCVAFPNVAPCDDGDPCLGEDTCMGGACQPGPVLLECDDGNLCTDDSCEPFVGCVAMPNADPCDDGDECFANDICAGGLCTPGPDALDCDDGNQCTGDACEPFAGCYHEPIAGPCDDDNGCTADDACLGGECIGAQVTCDDGNECTTDACQPATGCLFTPIKSKDCRPKIVITWPERGSTISGSAAITVTGTVTSKAGAIDSFVVNGEAVEVAADGSFSAPMMAAQGMNLIVAEATDVLGGSKRTTPSFYFSQKWYPIDQAKPEQSMVPDGIMAFLGPEVWDDNDTTDVDDLATIMTLYLDSLDLAGLITNPVTTGSFGWCTYQVQVSDITYGAPSVDLLPIDGGLHLLVVIPNFKAKINIPMSGFLCPSMSGTASASAITIDASVLIAMVNGQLTATMEGTSVTVHDLNISIDGIMGFLLNWLIDFFEGQFASQLEAAFEQQLGALIPATIVDALNSLALDQTMTMNPFLGDGPPVTLQIKTGLHSVDFSPAGGALGLKATVLAPKGTQHTPLGSIGRSTCLTGKPEPFVFPKLGQLELALHDDFFNQLPYGMYWGGLFAMDVAPAELGVDLSQYGLTDVNMHVDFMLPTILTTCTPDNVQVLQIGDIRVDGTMLMAGMPVEMVVFASVEVEATIVAVDKGGSKELSVALGAVRIMEVEVADVSGPLAGAEEMLVLLIEENLVGGLLDSFSEGALGSFPIPAIDLSGFDPSIPPGSAITLDLQQILRVFGYTVLSGGVK